jgi:hypothetical protein
MTSAPTAGPTGDPPNRFVRTTRIATIWHRHRFFFKLPCARPQQSPSRSTNSRIRTPLR